MVSQYSCLSIVEAMRQDVLLIFLAAGNLTNQHMASGFVELCIVDTTELVYECAHLSFALDITTDTDFEPCKNCKTVLFKRCLRRSNRLDKQVVLVCRFPLQSLGSLDSGGF